VGSGACERANQRHPRTRPPRSAARSWRASLLSRENRGPGGRPPTGAIHDAWIYGQTVSDATNLVLALGFQIVGVGLALWVIVVGILADGGWGAGVPDPLATIVLAAAIVLWLATGALMVRWRHIHPRLLWLLPATCVGLVLAMALLADAATTAPARAGIQFG
jgi:hypothetical protein